MVCLLFFNCKKEENRKGNFIYVISAEEKENLAELKQRKIPPPPAAFYSYNNLIMDKRGSFYFYQKEYSPWHCIPSEKDTIPDFFNIKPIEIVKIPPKDVVDFIKQNVFNKNEMKRMLVIASQNDTINSNILLSILNQKQLKVFSIRRTTQEEDTVLKYKKNDKFYHYEEIKWDKSRILLPERESDL